MNKILRACLVLLSLHASVDAVDKIRTGIPELNAPFALLTVVEKRRVVEEDELQGRQVKR